MRVAIIFLWSIFLFSGPSSYAQDCVPGLAAKAAAVNALSESLEPFIKTTVREVSFYHYGTRSSEGKVNLDEIINLRSHDGTYNGSTSLHPKNDLGKDIGSEYLHDLAYAALHSSDQDWELGRGLYTATDPIASVSYSGKPGFLLKVTVPVGTKYIDLRIQHRDIPVSVQNAQRLNCYFGSSSNRPFTNKFDYKYFFGSDLGREIMQLVQDRNRIVFTAGGYGLYNFKECRLNQKLQFMTMAVFQNSTFLQGVKTEIIVPNLQLDSPPVEKRSYESVYRYFEQFDCERGVYLGRGSPISLCNNGDFSVQKGADFKLYLESLARGLQMVPHRNEIIRKKVTSELFGCNQDYPDEYDVPSIAL